MGLDDRDNDKDDDNGNEPSMKASSNVVEPGKTALQSPLKQEATEGGNFSCSWTFA